ncbi:MFS transporter [Cupriavidus basilensis]|uniref:MFS transporter n=1 Tax=Cupriavidus basilensis TaxID=68895 RepID=A0A643G758_9BURK|nr:MFS transporter [Cupriavidus basilensis]QOT78332.1 MFS transporter [Cupriavidus basilensis]
MSNAGNTRSVAIDLTEFRRGWRVVLLAMLGLAVAANASLLYAFGALVIPLQNAFGWSRGELQPAISFLFGGAVVGAQMVGWFNQRWGMRRVTVLSLIALSVTFALMLLMGRSIWWLYLICALLPIAGMGTMHITWTHLVNLWFDRNRGLALALMLSGTGLSASLIPSAVTWSVARWGWQAAFLLLALLPLVLVVPLALRWLETPQDRQAASKEAVVAQEPVSGMAYRDAMRSARFWTINIALAMVVAAMVTMVSNTVPLLRDKGLSAAEASQVFGSFGLSLIGGRVLVGYLIDRLWAPGVAAVALVMPALGCLLLSTTGANQPGILALATLLIGIGAGAEFDIAAYLMARYFGMRDYGRLFGVHVALITIAAALAPWLFGLIYTATGSYTTMLAICGTAFLIGPMLLLPLGRYPSFTTRNLANELSSLSCH